MKLPAINPQIALTAIRTITGITLALHGAQKVFGAFGGSGLASFAQFLAPLGVPIWLSQLAAYCEFIGGVMLVLGVATEIGALLGIGVMIGAIFLVHISHGFFLENNGYEYALNLLVSCCALLVGGSGDYALFDPFKRDIQIDLDTHLL